MTERKKVIEKLTQTEILNKFQDLEKSTIEELKKIAEKLKSKEKAKIALLTHEKYDPDAIASPTALKRWFRSQGIKNENIEIFADGDPVSRETKVMIDKIGIEIHPLKDIDRRKHKILILLDAPSTKQANVKFKNGEADLIIDHHSDEAPYGSTATIVTLLLTVLNYEIEEDLATVLTIGIDTDTDNRTSKKITEFDTLAYRKILSPLVDDKLWKEIVDCGYSASYREMLSRAISKNYFFKKESTVISGVGYIKEAQRIYLPKIANFLLDEEGVEKVIVLAIVEHDITDKEGNTIDYKKFIVPTTRSSTGTENAGELNKRVFGEDVAGGDTFKASGAVPLSNGDIKFIERTKKHKNKEALEGYFIDILDRYKSKILEEETK